MFKRSRIKIVVALMAVLLVLFGGTVSLIYLASFEEVQQKNRNILQRYSTLYFVNGFPTGLHPPDEEDADGESLAEDDDAQARAGLGLRLGQSGDPGSADTDGDGRDERLYASTHIYAAAFDADGAVLGLDLYTGTAFTDASLTALCRTILQTGKTTGTADGMLYQVTAQNGVTLVALVDNAFFSDNLITLMRYTLLFGIIMTVLLFFFSIALARRIIAPLEDGYRRQKQFISDASHELKTPVAVVSANVEMLAREKGPSQWLDNIRFENERMAALVRQLLELARAENVRPVFGRVDLSHVVTGCTLPFEGVAFDRGHTLEYAIPDGLCVNGNAEQLGHLTTILLDNAVEHAAPGSAVRLALRAERKNLLLEVSNEGAPIPPAQQAHIFERFYRADEARADTGGTGRYGLGLAIARAIAEGHRGTIGVECRDGVTTFRVSLPALA